jgi:hypothetical protein
MVVSRDDAVDVCVEMVEERVLNAIKEVSINTTDHCAVCTADMTSGICSECASKAVAAERERWLGRKRVWEAQVKEAAANERERCATLRPPRAKHSHWTGSSIEIWNDAVAAYADAIRKPPTEPTHDELMDMLGKRKEPTDHPHPPYETCGPECKLPTEPPLRFRYDPEAEVCPTCGHDGMPFPYQRPCPDPFHR